MIESFPNVEEIDFQKYLQVIQRRWLSAVGIFGISVTVASMYAFSLKPTYEAQGSVLIKTDNTYSLKRAKELLREGFPLVISGAAIYMYAKIDQIQIQRGFAVRLLRVFTLLFLDALCAEKLQAVLEAKNEIKDGVLFKLKDDPRVTKVGKFLRRYSLDELPQLFNVIFGEMSLVGPRPLPLRDVERFKKMHFIRQDVLPGITGLWQVSGRSDIENFEEGVKLDISYIENWSVWLDLKILFKTVGVVLNKTGAY
ncbi:glucosyltransferase [Calothrix sp. NIES-4071]|nr:glucosyltransferase [Calothrix sp. NIES-4071]BAZ59170.1 glucosyltransferase [Calothrix sp. NIES-4105]